MDLLKCVLALCLSALFLALPETASAQCVHKYPGCGICQSGVTGRERVGCSSCGRRCYPALETSATAAADASAADAADGLATDTEGLKFEVELARRFVGVNPAVASTLLTFREGEIGNTTNLLRGAMAFRGIPTAQTFELATRFGADESQNGKLQSEINKSLRKLPAGRYLQVRWDAIDVDSETLQVTFISEIIDDSMRALSRASPNVVLLVSKSTRAVLSLTEQ